MLNPDSMGAWGVMIALAGGAVRGSIPYMFVSLGECLTEKSGRINLGMEGSSTPNSVAQVSALTAAREAAKASQVQAACGKKKCNPAKREAMPPLAST